MNRSIGTWIALCFLAALLWHETAEAKEYKLYFLGGQSNMDGYGYIEELPAEINQNVAGVYIFHGNTAPDGAAADGRGIWAELRPGHGAGFKSDGMTNTYSDRFGVELTFARRLRELDPESNIAIIKYSRGGTSIDTAAAGNHGCWEIDFEGGTGAGQGVNQYDHFRATVRQAAALRDIDWDGDLDRLTPAGIVWMQGESDAYYTEEIACRYQDNLKRLMDQIRVVFGADEMAVVIGRISDSGKDDDGKLWDHGEIVRDAQAAFVEADGHAALVTETDSYGYSDPWHYDTPGYIDLGRRFAEAMLDLQPQ
ncbi:MAG: hypothetical protein JSU77_02165 [Fidelibacterota bacterium]|nr:MAG: hypothetical protein JSU77_02165 [Candidatus Neomarinimicrobiota bacterium]